LYVKIAQEGNHNKLYWTTIIMKKKTIKFLKSNFHNYFIAVMYVCLPCKQLLVKRCSFLWNKFSYIYYHARLTHNECKMSIGKHVVSNFRSSLWALFYNVWHDKLDLWTTIKMKKANKF
jgi:hypothetical protein